MAVFNISATRKMLAVTMIEKLIAEFAQHVNKKEAVITAQVYLELCEIKRYFDITYTFNSALNKIIIAAKKTKNVLPCMFVPITVNEKLSFLKIKTVLRLTEQRTIFLVIVHADSTCVYYQLTDGLLEPTDTIAKHLKENKQEKLDNDLKKNREVIEQAALFGVKVALKGDMREEPHGKS